VIDHRRRPHAAVERQRGLEGQGSRAEDVQRRPCPRPNLLQRSLERSWVVGKGEGHRQARPLGVFPAGEEVIVDLLVLPLEHVETARFAPAAPGRIDEAECAGQETPLFPTTAGEHDACPVGRASISRAHQPYLAGPLPAPALRDLCRRAQHFLVLDDELDALGPHELEEERAFLDPWVDALRARGCE
jgi:hypothetical protein